MRPRSPGGFTRDGRKQFRQRLRMFQATQNLGFQNVELDFDFIELNNRESRFNFIEEKLANWNWRVNA
jgi:hypothetical protein